MAASDVAELLSFEQFAGIQQPWDELVAAGEFPVPFMLHAWLSAWWKHFGAGQEFVAVVVRRDGRLVAGAPLAIRRAGLAGAAVRVAELVGTGPVPTRGMGLADKADVVVHRDFPQARGELAEAVVGLLDRCSVLDLKGFDAGSATTEVFTEWAPRPASVRTLRRSVSPYLPLDEGWDAYLASRSGNFRKHLRKYRRLLEREGPLEVVRFGPDDDTSVWMGQLFEVNHASWKGERGTNLFRSPRLRDFFSEVVPTLASQGAIDLHALRVGGRMVAYELCFDFAGKLFSYNSSFLIEMGRMSPGTALTAAVIEAAWGRDRKEYDMLRGAEGYKLRWSEKMRQECRLVIPAGGLASRIAAYIGVVLKARLKQWEWLEIQTDRVSGMLSRFRFGRR